MSKEDVLKELIIMVQRKNRKEQYGLGSRSETSSVKTQRSKDIRAFLVDLFDPYYEGDVGELLHMLESEIDRNVHGDDILFTHLKREGNLIVEEEDEEENEQDLFIEKCKSEVTRKTDRALRGER